MSTPHSYSYNLPGHGLVNYRLYPHAAETWSYLERHGRIRHLRRTDQLGALKSIYPGAHHTRFEYIVVQLAIINKLCELTGHQAEGFHLSSKLRDNHQLDLDLGNLSKGDALQCIVLLNNIGHLSTTYAGERALLEFLRIEKKACTAFIEGLNISRDDRREVRKSVKSDHTIRLHQYLAIFLLSRYRRTRKDKLISDFLINLFHSYIKTAPYFQSLKLLYSSIRKLAYISLDSLYTPVPFSLDLLPIFTSIEYHLKNVFRAESGFQLALNQLDIVLRDTVYMSPQAVNHFSLVTFETLNLLKDKSDLLYRISGMKKVIESDIFIQGLEQVKPEKTSKIVTLNYKIIPANLAIRTVQKESDYRHSRNSSNSNTGYLIDYSNNLLRVTGSIKYSCNDSISRSKAFKIGSTFIDIELLSRNRGDHSIITEDDNLRNIFIFLISSIFGWNRVYRTRNISNTYANFLLERGSRKIHEKISDYCREFESENILDPDKIMQIKVLMDVLKAHIYRGVVLAYFGETEVINGSDTVAEFDGVVLFISKSSNSRCIIIEAKNKPCGHTEAHNQLQSRLRKLDSGVQWDLNTVGSKGAYAVSAL